MAEFQPRFDPLAYEPEAFKKYGPAAMRQMRAEYTRMRDVAQKRLDRLAKSEFVESQAYLRHKDGFKKLKDMKEGELPFLMHDLFKFVTSRSSTVTGQKKQRKRAVDSFRLRYHGVDGMEALEDMDEKAVFGFMQFLGDLSREAKEYKNDSPPIDALQFYINSGGMKGSMLVDAWKKHKEAEIDARQRAMQQRGQGVKVDAKGRPKKAAKAGKGRKR